MENEIQINTPAESVIAAYGIASWRRFLPQFLGAGIVLIAALLIFGFFWLFAGTVHLPGGTTFLGITSPRTLYDSLSAEARGRLPEPWRLVIEHRSRSPVLFGAARHENAWEFFAIAPRWSIPAHPGLLTQTTRAVSLLYADANQSTSSTTTYLSWWGKTLRHPSALGQFESYPTLLASSFLTTEALHGIVYRDHLETDLHSSHLPEDKTLQSGDIFLRFDPEATTTARTALLQSLNLEDGNTLQTIHPTQLTLDYNSSGTTDRVTFSTQTTMSSSTKLSLLAGLGFSKKTVQALPDGSLLVEQRLPNEQELKTETAYAIPGGSLELTDTHYQLQKGATSTETLFNPCGTGVTTARFSGQALQQLFKTLDLDFLPTHTGIQFYQSREYISACLE